MYDFSFKVFLKPLNQKREYQDNTDKTIHFQVAALFERVKETLAERMLVMPWLDEETRTQAVFRLRSLRGKFQIWPGFLNETLLAHEMTEVSQKDSYLCKM